MKTKLSLFTLLVATFASSGVGHAQYTTPTTPSTSTTSKMALDRLPQAVQDTVRKEAAGREIAKVDRETWNGQPSYRIQFKESGRNPDIYVADNGSVIRPEEKPPGATTLFMGTKFENTPTAVQDAIRREIGTGEITKIDREGRKNSRYYKVYVKQPQGGAYELQVSENGQILNDSRKGMTK